MDVKVEEKSALTKKITIILPAEEVSKELDAAYRKLKTDVKLKGFRKGKAPRSILEKNYGEQIRAEVGETLVQSTYFDAVEQEKIDAVVHPEITKHIFSDDGTFIYEAEVDVRPRFELKNYKGLEIEKPELVVEDAEVNEELERLRKEMAPLKSVADRPVRTNDIVIIDFQGFHDGERLKQVGGENFTVDVGAGRNGEEFEGKLVGMRKHDEAVHEIEFPADHKNPVLAGKKVEFKIMVQDVKERVVADLDDEFAKDVGEEFSSLDDLKKYVKEKKLKEKEDALQGDLADKIMKALLEEHDFEVPSRLVRYEIEEHIKQTEESLQRQGITLEAAGINLDEMAAQYKETATRRVRGDFILKRISEQESIKLVDEDINNGLGRIAAQYNMSIDEVKKFFKKREDMLPLINELLNEKILKFLMDQADFKSVAAKG